MANCSSSEGGGAAASASFSPVAGIRGDAVRTVLASTVWPRTASACSSATGGHDGTMTLPDCVWRVCCGCRSADAVGPALGGVDVVRASAANTRAACGVTLARGVLVAILRGVSGCTMRGGGGCWRIAGEEGAVSAGVGGFLLNSLLCTMGGVACCAVGWLACLTERGVAMGFRGGVSLSLSSPFLSNVLYSRSVSLSSAAADDRTASLLPRAAERGVDCVAA